MKLDLDGKVVLITGGSRGIGRASAKRFLDADAIVAVTGRHPAALSVVREELGPDVMTFAGNAADEHHAAATVQELIARHGRLDILVNNAATSPYHGPTHLVDLPRLDKTWSVNVRAPLVWIQQAWHQYMQENGGNVINVASIGAFLPGGPTGVYNLTKAALVYLTQQLASELAPGVRVNAVAPGVIKTDMSKAIWSQHAADTPYSWPLKRLGRPEDIAEAILYFASGLSSWMTGHTMVVDGGAMSNTARDVTPG
jgi:NAD(P)-dependent dehydrogenase (short-subunit alcohol dehydrogenase family)